MDLGIVRRSTRREDLSPKQYWENHVKLWHDNGEDSGGDACGATNSDSNDNRGVVGEVGGVKLLADAVVLVLATSPY